MSSRFAFKGEMVTAAIGKFRLNFPLQVTLARADAENTGGGAQVNKQIAVWKLSFAPK